MPCCVTGRADTTTCVFRPTPDMFTAARGRRRGGRWLVWTAGWPWRYAAQAASLTVGAPSLHACAHAAGAKPARARACTCVECKVVPRSQLVPGRRPPATLRKLHAHLPNCLGLLPPCPLRRSNRVKSVCHHYRAMYSTRVGTQHALLAGRRMDAMATLAAEQKPTGLRRLATRVQALLVAEPSTGDGAQCCGLRTLLLHAVFENCRRGASACPTYAGHHSAPA